MSVAICWRRKFMFYPIVRFAPSGFWALQWTKCRYYPLPPPLKWQMQSKIYLSWAWCWQLHCTSCAWLQLILPIGRTGHRPNQRQPLTKLEKTFHKNITAQGRVKTSQELRMLSSVTINCQVTKMSWFQVLNCQYCNQCLKCHKLNIREAIL